MTTALLGLICTALIVAVPIVCLFLVRPQMPEHQGAVGELITIGGEDFRITSMSWDGNGTQIVLRDHTAAAGRWWSPQ